MIDVDAALRLLRNIVGDGLIQQDVGEWMASGIAHLSPELDLQDFATLARLVSGETIEPWRRPGATVPPRLVTDQIMPNQSPPITEPPRRYVVQPPSKTAQPEGTSVHWDVV